MIRYDNYFELFSIISLENLASHESFCVKVTIFAS